MPVLKVKPTTQKMMDEEAIENTALVTALFSQRLAALMAALAEAVNSQTAAAKPRAWVRRELAALYCAVLEEIDRELDGDDGTWRTLLTKVLPRRQGGAARRGWLAAMKDSGRGNSSRLNSGALAAYLAGDFDNEQAQP